MATTSSGPAPESWREWLASEQIERSLIFSERIRRAKRMQYPSEIEPELLRFLDSANSLIRQQLEELKSDPGFADLPDREAETQLLRFSILYTHLCFAAALVEGASQTQAVAELAAPLKRTLVPVLGTANLLLHPLPEINYSFLDLGELLNSVVNEMGLTQDALPRDLYAVGFPSLQEEWSLMHCIIGHELGHALYKRFRMVDKIGPLIRIDEAKINDLVGSIHRDVWGYEADAHAPVESQAQLPLGSVQLRAATYKAVSRVLEYWIEEICSDGIGLHLFGPAFLLSAISFLANTRGLDYCSDDHPPARMRFRILFSLLRLRMPVGQSKNGPWSSYQPVLGQHVAAFLDTWESLVNAADVGFSNPYHAIAGSAILAVYPRMCARLQKLISQSLQYDIRQHVGDIEHLERDILLSIPPNEVRGGDGMRPAALASIFNAGWRAYLGGVQRLAKENGWSAWEAKAKLNQWVAKGIELAEVQTRWGEVQ